MTALDRRTEIDILTVLSDFIPRNQNDITKAIGKSKERSTDRVKVHRAIGREIKYLARTLPGMDDTGKVWALKKKPETIGQVVTDYPELFSHFQSNDTVLDMLVDKHVNHVCMDEWLSDEQVRDFRNRLMISATFFRLYLFESPAKLLNILETLFSITEWGHDFERLNKRETVPCEKYGFARYKPSFSDMLDVAFRACVGADILYHRECIDGIELIKKLKYPEEGHGKTEKVISQNV